ncbi:MAG: hypothetical protein GY906_13070 [bacterium]|nr:hypothetical protein [bacterium]
MTGIKPGAKTSEALGGLGLVGGIYVFIKDAPEPVQIAGIIAVGVLGAAYMISRALVKRK